jgi:alpha-beta hydrolase superfamily lysophospholipase
MAFLALISLSIVLFLLHAGVIVLVIGPLTILQPTRKRPEWYAAFTNLLEPHDAGLPEETHRLRTPDGIDLHAWYIPQKRNPKGTIIYLHGVGDCKIGGIPLARYFFTQGYSVLMYDQRQHGESGGSICTYGYYEKHDVSVALDFLEERQGPGHETVAIFGTSMGAAIAIQAAAIEPRIKGIIAEASFANLRDIITDYQRRIIKLPWHFLRNAALARTQAIANFRGADVSPLTDVKNISIPLLFIHGTEDKSIDVEYSRHLYEAAHEPKRLVLIEGADHNDIWSVGGKKYLDSITTFLSDYLEKT